MRENLTDKDDKGVLNLSLWGNGPMIMYSTLKEYLPLNKVKNILWLHSQGNDFTDITFEQKVRLLTIISMTRVFPKTYLNDKMK